MNCEQVEPVLPLLVGVGGVLDEANTKASDSTSHNLPTLPHQIALPIELLAIGQVLVLVSPPWRAIMCDQCHVVTKLSHEVCCLSIFHGPANVLLEVTHCEEYVVPWWQWFNSCSAMWHKWGNCCNYKSSG